MGRLATVVFFGLALWALYGSLHHHHYRDIVEAYRELPSSRLVLALAFTACGYLALTGYDLLAFRFILASPGGLALPAILVDVAALMAGGLFGIVLK